MRLHRPDLRELTGGSGIQWPCNDQYPEGKERLYTDGVFSTERRPMRDIRPRP